MHGSFFFFFPKRQLHKVDCNKLFFLSIRMEKIQETQALYQLVPRSCLIWPQKANISWQSQI